MPEIYPAAMESVWRHYAMTVLGVLANLAISYFAVMAIRAKKPNLLCERNRAFLVLGGSFLLMVAGMGGVGWKIQTFDASTLEENWNEAALQILAHLGGFSIFLDLVSVAFEKCKRSQS